MILILGSVYDDVLYFGCCYLLSKMSVTGLKRSLMSAMMFWSLLVGNCLLRFLNDCTTLFAVLPSSARWSMVVANDLTAS